MLLWDETVDDAHPEENVPYFTAASALLDSDGKPTIYTIGRGHYDQSWVAIHIAGKHECVMAPTDSIDEAKATAQRHEDFRLTLHPNTA